jgi:acyl-CoA thioester hydrolase
MSGEDPVGRHRLRVRYAETDRMGVSHHSSTIVWFEEARTEWLRARGQSYRAMEEAGVFLQVVEVQVSYLAPSTYDDELEIATRVVERRPASITLGYEITRPADGTRIATGSTRLACVDREGRLRRLPAGL